MRCWTRLWSPSGILIRTQPGMAAAWRSLRWRGAASFCPTGCLSWHLSWPQPSNLTSDVGHTGGHQNHCLYSHNILLQMLAVHSWCLFLHIWSVPVLVICLSQHNRGQLQIRGSGRLPSSDACSMTGCCAAAVLAHTLGTRPRMCAGPLRVLTRVMSLHQLFTRWRQLSWQWHAMTVRCMSISLQGSDWNSQK